LGQVNDKKIVEAYGGKVALAKVLKGYSASAICRKNNFEKS
jgi:bifunctional ADP-heptose synthase (sugar kinase/adenylyltransferase)